jgi:hypothetical protein
MSAIASTQILALDRIKLHFISGLIRSSQYLSDSPEERLRQRIDLNYLHASYINSAMPILDPCYKASILRMLPSLKSIFRLQLFSSKVPICGRRPMANTGTSNSTPSQNTVAR